MLRASLPILSKRFDYVIVGGGNAAGYACREFVARGVGAGRIAVVSDEPVAPYERPALTKAYLHPPTAKVRARLPGFHTCVGGGGERQSPEWYKEKGIEILSGRCQGVNLGAKEIKSDLGDIGYEKLLLATGARALRLSDFGVKGDTLRNVCYVRSEADAAALVGSLEGLATGSKVVVIGGGYIGMECAAAVSGWGFDTTMLFPEPFCMSRLFDENLATWLEAQMKARGIVIRKGDASAVATELAGSDGAVSSVHLKSGDVLPADLVIVGVGSQPNVEFLQGLDMEAGGVKVDNRMQTSQPDVFAMGDISAFPSRYGGFSRCEHVDHARRSASQAVQAALGVTTAPYDYLPYFYSRIFEYTDKPIVFNFFGAAAGAPRTVELPGDSIGALWIDAGKVKGALLMGCPGPSPEQAAKLRQFVIDQPECEGEATSSLARVFQAAGLLDAKP